MAVGLPLKTTYANGDVYSASDVNDTNGTVNLFTSSTLSRAAAKNCIINGGFDIAQRGTSGTFTTTAKSFSLDRWWITATTGTSMTYSQQASTVASTRYAGRFGRTNLNAGTALINIGQDVETSNSIIYAGQAVTVSFYARAGANFSSASNALTHYTIQGTGTDQSDYGAAMTGRTVLTTGTATLTTSFQRFTYTATVASTTTELNFQVGYTPTGTAGANDWFEITGVQIELGSATTFSRAGGTIQGELAACQRYYEKSYDQAQAPGGVNNYIGTTNLTIGTATTGNLYLSTSFAVVKRGTPTVTLYDGLGASGKVFKGANGKNASITDIGNRSFRGGTTDTTSASELGYHWVAESEL
jgi:hypothetical protein